jgi:hypothetical protein
MGPACMYRNQRRFHDPAAALVVDDRGRAPRGRRVLTDAESRGGLRDAIAELPWVLSTAADCRRASKPTYRGCAGAQRLLCRTPAGRRASGP